MGLNFGRKSLYGTAVVPASVQPNPYRFTIKREVSFGSYVLAEVNYPDATNFEGNKILLVYGRTTLTDLKELDPHFLEDGAVQLVARFHPSANGWAAGIALMAGLAGAGAMV
jgi:hypothetical protein